MNDNGLATLVYSIIGVKRSHPANYLPKKVIISVGFKKREGVGGNFWPSCIFFWKIVASSGNFLVLLLNISVLFVLLKHTILQILNSACKELIKKIIYFPLQTN